MEERKQSLREMKICRFCFHSDDNELSNIYQKEVKMIPLPVQIMSCISIEVFPNDGLPQLICHTCKQQTNQSYIFKSNCKKADDALKSFLQTGELIRPEILKPPQSKSKKRSGTPVISPVKDVKIVSNKSSTSETPDIKRIKLEDGTEIITLCISQPDSVESPDESSQDSIQEEHSDKNAEEAESETYQRDNSFDPLDVPEQIETDIFPCEYCDRTFPLKQLLELHLTNHHRERQFGCPQCDNKFFTKYDMLKHQQTHSDAKPFTCSVCNKVFGREALLRRHEQTHIDAPKYMCTQCERTFLVKTDLDSHMKKHEKRRPFTCESCDKSFVFKQGLERHMNSVHAQDRPHKCNYCESSFNSPIRLTRHITTHAGLRPYPCKICARTFLLSHHLTRHMRSHYAADQGKQPEEAVRQHKCDVCSMAFKRKDSLINHSAIHSMVNLRCVICNTSFESAKMVKDHITIHLQGLSFACEKCDYSFETQDQLEEHELKHAEMEYEELIEQEVISEVNQIRNQQTEESEIEDGEFVDEDEVTEFHIPDIHNPTLIPSKHHGSHGKNAASHSAESLQNIQQPPTSAEKKQQENADGLNQFFKTEMTDTEGEGEGPPHVTGEDEGHYMVDGENSIRPIFRLEGTKMYERKGPIQRKIPKVQPQPQNVQTVPLEDINEPLNMGSITQEALNNLPSKRPVNVKVGDKVVKVQKFIISKEEMKQMAKLGILELKNGQVTMRNPGQPILNAIIKPVQQSDIESLLNSQKNLIKPPIKQYERRGQSSQCISEITVQNIVEDFD